MEQADCYCSLTLGEMSITNKTEYCFSTRNISGSVTSPDYHGHATHGLVFMLSGVSSRWKQNIA